MAVTNSASDKPKPRGDKAPSKSASECDLIMRGGITSGIVYPSAIAMLSQHFRFRNIGGTSAGAIAAAATAAAEYGRISGKNGKSFDQLDALPDELAKKQGNPGGQTNLDCLFKPDAKTKPVYAVIRSLVGRRWLPLKIASSLFRLCLAHPLIALISTAICGLPTFLLLNDRSSIAGAAYWGVLGSNILVTAVVVYVVTAVAMVFHARSVLPRNWFGLCSGRGSRRGSNVPALTDWMHETIQGLAGLDMDEPLTVGHLWGAAGQDQRDIQLVLMTTNITRGVSHRFPYLRHQVGMLFFKKSELRQLFPGAVVQWMIDHPPSDEEAVEQVLRTDDHYPLPDAKNLPVLLGARLSLSFPILLGQVPLYAADPTNRQSDGRLGLQKCWFSDGGLTSNFPIYLFDAPIPTRPTFGINLMPVLTKVDERSPSGANGNRTANRDSADSKTQDPASANDHDGLSEEEQEAWRMVYMPTDNSGRPVTRYNNFEQASLKILGFADALIDTARNWSETQLMSIPGYRDRIVHIRLKPNEGGLNLDMPGDVIQALKLRGRCAAQMLIARYGTNQKTDPNPLRPTKIVLNWRNHQWIRYRAMAAALEAYLTQFCEQWAKAQTEYEDLLRGPRDKLPSYKWTNNQRSKHGVPLTDGLRSVVAQWTERYQTFDDATSSSGARSPRPKPELRLLPPGDNDVEK